MQLSNSPVTAGSTCASPRAAAIASSIASAQLALVRAAGPAVQVGVAEALLLHVGDQPGLVEVIEPDGAQPRPQQAAGVGR